VSRSSRLCLGLLLLAALAPGCLTYETSQTRVSIDQRTGLARVEVLVQNVATTETGRGGQWEDFEQLDSLRRSDAYFAGSFLRSPGGGHIVRRRAWIDHGQIHASYVITTRDLNQIAEGWSADSSGYRYTSLLTITRTNGQRTGDEKPSVMWPRSAPLLIVAEQDPHFSEAFPFLPEIRKSLAARLKAKAPQRRAAAHAPSHKKGRGH
jgi:hypothetical protein